MDASRNGPLRRIAGPPGGPAKDRQRASTGIEGRSVRPASADAQQRALQGDLLPSSLNQIKPLQQKDGNNGAPSLPVPDPVVDENGPRGRIPIRCFTASLERKRNDQEVGVVGVFTKEV